MTKARIVLCSKNSVNSLIEKELSKIPSYEGLIPVKFSIKGFSLADDTSYLTQEQYDLLIGILRENNSIEDDDIPDNRKPYSIYYSSRILTEHNLKDENEMYNSVRLVISKGNHYTDSGYKKDDGINFLGFGGKRFKYRMLKDDKEYITNNLFYQFEIPDYLAKYLPDNAEFI